MDNLLIAVSVITGLTQVVKQLGVPTKYIPLTAVLFGMIYTSVFVAFSANNILAGIVAGLTSVGLYRTVQKTIK